tara:strand:- start:7688 stop:8044 length:357 start_codon:yes stop_codon:yes gene_type:complete
MNVSEVLDSSEVSSSFSESEPLHAGDKITIQSFKVKFVDSIGADVAEIKTTEGVRHTFAKAIVGQAQSDWWLDILKRCIKKDASDGLNAWVVEKTAKETGRPMLTLSAYDPTERKPTQ